MSAVQRFLNDSGFVRGRPQKQHSLAVMHSVALRRDTYLQKIRNNRSLEIGLRWRRVFLDESYIHHHYQGNNSLFHCDIIADIPLQKFKGKRYCFIAAIIDCDRNVDEYKRKLSENSRQW
jgi:hypothetical protein